MKTVETKPGARTGLEVKAGVTPDGFMKIIDESAKTHCLTGDQHKKLGNYVCQIADAIFRKENRMPTQAEMEEACRDYVKGIEYAEFIFQQKMLSWERRAFFGFMFKHGYGHWSSREDIRNRLQDAYKIFGQTLEAKFGEHLDETCEDDGPF